MMEKWIILLALGLCSLVNVGVVALAVCLMRLVQTSVSCLSSFAASKQAYEASLGSGIPWLGPAVQRELARQKAATDGIAMSPGHDRQADPVPPRPQVRTGVSIQTGLRKDGASKGT